MLFVDLVLTGEVAPLDASFTDNELFYGAAGAGLSWLGGGPEHLAAAVRAGEQLEREAVPRDVGCAWPWGPAIRDIYVGWAHGAAGIAQFLFRLGEVTRDERWITLGGRALEFVRSRAAKRFGGLVFPVHDTPVPEKPFTYLCHGSAGIALAFLEASRVTGEARWGEAAEGCLGAVENFLITHEVKLTCVCHGVAGLLLPLIAAGRSERARAYAERLLVPRRAEVQETGLLNGRDGVELVLGKLGL